MKRHILAFLFIASVKGIPVAEFQPDGFFSEETYLNYTTQIAPENLTDFSFCFWINLNFLRDTSTSILSFSTDIYDNGLLARYYIKDGKDLTSPVRLRICKYSECLEHNLGQKEHQEWHHICFTYKVSFGMANTIIGKRKLHYDGQLVSEGNSKFTDDFLTLYHGGNLVLGQDSDAILYGGQFDAMQSFSGKMSQFEMWNIELGTEQIQSLASCQVNTIEANKIVSWTSKNWDFVNVSMSDSDNFCLSSDLLAHKLIWTEIITQVNFKEMCDRVNGKLPMVTEEKENWKKIHEENRKVFAKLGNDSEQCFVDDENVAFWVAIGKKSQNEGWQSLYEPFEDFYAKSLINGFGYDCGIIKGKILDPHGCDDKFPCGLCELDPEQIYYLKGLCEEDIERRYDVKYYIHGVKNSRPYFRGISKSHIFFNNLTSKWVLESLWRPNTSILTRGKWPEEIPIGTFEWRSLSENGLCKLPENSVRKLTLSTCYPYKFTCNSGHCIPLSDRCDIENDCLDESDETECEYLNLGSNYGRNLVPREFPKEPCLVYINISILAFPFIETVNLKYTADIFLNLRWYDFRIDFMDLNEITTLNSLSRKDREAIWTPRLDFLNALGPVQTVMDDLSSGVLIREAGPLPEDITFATEVMLFGGKENSIFLTREYYQDFSCPFELYYYPFDTQVCEMIFRVQSKTENFIKLVVDGNGVEFLSPRKLVEYEIQAETLQITSDHNISTAKLRTVFRRRMEYHVANTFLQTFVLMLVGYLSFFFHIENFTDRIMVALTTMLVIATITSAIQQSLPKTSYYKLIDWWLLVVLNFLVILMAFHTFLAHLVTRAKDEDLNLTNGSGLFAKRSTGTYQENTLDNVKRINNVAKIAFALCIVIFNIVFWSIAIIEYLRPAEDYL